MAEPRRTIILQIFIGLSVFLAVTTAVAFGFALAATINNPIERLGEYQVALPSQILDRNGKLITEFFSDEKREIVSIDELPKHLIYALITREDQGFYKHKGISLKGNLRAVWNMLLGRSIQGASTITQLTVGQMGYVDRTQITLSRKFKEWWYALQIERVLTKNEILEILLNGAYFGSGTNGVEAASRFYFQHSARDLTLAESVLLVLQISAPSGLYNPYKNPKNASERQHEILMQMVDLGYTTREEAERSFDQYWSGYDYTRPSTTSAFMVREDKAPWFSEYIRGQLEQMILGTNNIYRDGFVVHTTLDLDMQAEAEKNFAEGLTRVNTDYQSNSNKRYTYSDDLVVPIVDMLSLAFDIDEIKVAGKRERQNSREFYQNVMNPSIDMLSMMFGIDDLKYTANMGYLKQKDDMKKTVVEGAMITIDNDTGYILTMIGGSRFEGINQLNRATQANVQPGSAFKPLYYSAALDTGKFTPATAIWDGPVVFWNDDGSPYRPLNFKGEWKGWVRLRTALAHSMNVPSIKVLDGIGFDAAINRASTLLGMTSPSQIAGFPRKYPLGLGVIGVSPIQMARAYATFATGGREVVPVAIRYIEDRNGKIILEPEKDIRLQQKKKSKESQLISPQNAYLMTSLLQTTVQEGTLSSARYIAGDFMGMPMAGKTGTTQNWADIWTVGFSPYLTTAVWYGFDKPGNSLGVMQTGAVVAGPAWAKFMKAAHKGLPLRDFPKPASGIREITVCAVSGKIPTESCNEGTIKELFLSGTDPKEFCDIHDFRQEQNDRIITRVQGQLSTELFEFDLDDEPLSAEPNLKPPVRTGPGSDPGYFPGLDLNFATDEDLLTLPETESVDNPLLD